MKISKANKKAEAWSENDPGNITEKTGIPQRSFSQLINIACYLRSR
jgi:hypothetical protein